MTLLDAALAHASKGRPVFPCKPATKRPLVPHGFKDATTDPDQIMAWWREWPDALIGMPTGSPSRVWVLDVDVDAKKNGEQALISLMNGHPALPHTVESGTPRGGRHIFFRHPGHKIKCSTSELGPGLDVRGDGGYVILPPSVTPAGKYYHWEVGASPDDGIHAASAPEWLVEKVTQRSKAKPTQNTALGGIATITDGHRNDTLFRLGRSLRAKGLGEPAILAALIEENVEKCQPPLAESEVSVIAKSSASVAPGRSEGYETKIGPSTASGRRSLQWIPAELPDIATAAEIALVETKEQIYQRSGMLVRPVRLDQPMIGPVRRPEGAITLAPVTTTYLVDHLTRVCEWTKFDARTKTLKPIACPDQVVETILSRAGSWHFPTLRSVVTHPVMSPDRYQIIGAGFDEKTGLLVDFSGNWQVPLSPSQKDAMESASKLRNLIRFFPFATPVDEAVALSLLVTAIVRPTLPTAPLQATDAPAAGSGKSLLIDAASILSTGNTAPVISYGDTGEEFEKRLDGMLLAGDTLIAIDNIKVPLEGDALCQSITQMTRRVRPLGSSTMVTIPVTAFFTATGNNLTIKGDMTRRALVCRIDANVERPELRDIEQDLKSECSERRRELVSEILTIVFAYQRSGRPSVGIKPLGSFEAWSSTVRAALIWAGVPDPCLSMERIRSVDPDRGSTEVVFSAWFNAFGSDPHTSSDVFKECVVNEPLRDAILSVAASRGSVDTRLLGNWLKRQRDRVVGGFILTIETGNTAGSARWRVRKI